MRVINESRIDFKYRFSSESPVITKTIYSNIVYTTIVRNCLLVKKSVDKKVASHYDILKYKIEISNISCDKINNVKFKDCLEDGIKFISNTVVINGKLKKCCNPMEGIPLGTMYQADSIIISFKAVVDKRFYKGILSNYCIISFDYIYNIEKPPLCFNIESNKADTICKNDLFKQCMVKKKIKVSSVCGKIDKVLKIESEVNVIKSKVLNCIVNEDLLNVLLICSIKYKIYYVNNSKKRIFITSRGFSTNVVIPRGVEYFDKISIQIENEKTSYIIMNRSDIFIANSLLINI
ncbi:MAG: DUF11 domain-containing protein [Clostridium sp.]|uniref:DUF11 domain-containing protein n=1 Tax=Clostridium sp. TaxID=1506 RepID=UPI003F2C9916